MVQEFPVYMQKKNKVFIIAEAGVNHNNDFILAKKLIKEAKRCGADAVKFQAFKTENYIVKKAPLAGYQKKNTNYSNQFNLIKELELSGSKLKQLMIYAKKIKINFLASAFDNPACEAIASINSALFIVLVFVC